MHLEIWRPVLGHPYYEVSDQGRVRSLGQWARVRGGGERWVKGRVLKPGKGDGAHFTVTLNGKSRNVHSLVADAFLPEKPFPRAELRHRDGDHGNNTAINLVWSTRADNTRDKKYHAGQKGRLTIEQVREIKVRLQHPYRGIGKDLAAEFGVGCATITHIRKGRNHAEVTV